MTPSQDLLTAVVELSLGFSKGVNAFPGGMRPVSSSIPVNALFSRGLPGGTPIRVMTEGYEIRGLFAQLALRWKNHPEGESKMLSIMDNLMGVTPSGYLDMYTSQSHPTHAGPTEEGHHIFYCTYVMRYSQVAA